MKPQIAMILMLVLSLPPSAARAEPPTVQEVKQAFARAIAASGYEIDDTTNSIIERASLRIAATKEDMRHVRVFAEQVDGMEHGFCFSLFPNGEVQRTGFFAKGKRVGPWRFYFPDGTLSSKLQYNDDGKRIGQHVSYFRDGNVHYVETYVDGVKHGPKTTFYEDGTTHVHQMWQQGQMHGFSVIYYPNGVVKKFASWANGQQHGVVVFYNELGQVTEQSQYVNGRKD